MARGRVSGGVHSDVTSLNAVPGLALAFLIGACAPQAAPSQAAPSAPVDPPPETPAAATSASASPSPPAPLSELLPRTLAGVELHTFAVGGDMLARLAATLGLEVSDVEVAFASEHGARFFQSYAVRAPAVEGVRLMNAFVNSAYDVGEGEVAVSEEVIGGKSVTVVLQPSTSARIGTYYAYTAGGVLFIVQTMDPAVAEEVLPALP